jgi:hypothetical protein
VNIYRRSWKSRSFGDVAGASKPGFASGQVPTPSSAVGTDAITHAEPAGQVGSCVGLSGRRKEQRTVRVLGVERVMACSLRRIGAVEVESPPRPRSGWLGPRVRG